MLSNVVRSQVEEHSPYGGVVPEIAARAHVEVLDLVIAQAMKEAGIGFDALSGIAAAAGRGSLAGSLSASPPPRRCRWPRASLWSP